MMRVWEEIQDAADRCIKRTLIVLTSAIVLISVIAIIAVFKSLYLVLAQCVIVIIILIPTVTRLYKSINN
jgi:hypothetical protein